MMRKTIIYIAFAFKAVFLIGIKLFDTLSIILVPSKTLLRTIVFTLFLLSTFNISLFAQGPGNCGSGERFCLGECRPARKCRPGVPPPPGLPIDSKLPYLLIAGLGLGIYFLKVKKPA